jgi:predicted O-methyltransferase YrrM
VRRERERLGHGGTVVAVPPPLVQRALVLAEQLGFARSCSEEVGRLLHVLAAARGRTRVAEVGAGAGVGAAWIVSGLAPDVPFFTAELDAARAAAVAELFAEDANVRVLPGDWRDTLPGQAPFDLVFLDAAKQLRPDEDAELVAGLLVPGGLVLLDDLTPGRLGHDPVRAAWLGRGDLVATELLASPREACILAVRR